MLNPRTPLTGMGQSSHPAPKLVVHPVGENQYRLACPDCGQEAKEVLTWSEVQSLAWSGQSSRCIECDPAANTPAAYRLDVEQIVGEVC